MTYNDLAKIKVGDDRAKKRSPLDMDTSAPLATSNGARSQIAPREPPARVQKREFRELKRRIKEKELLKQQPLFYTLVILLTMGMLAASLTVLVAVDSLWFQLLNAVFLAFIFGQLAIIGHDGGHLQIFRNTRRADCLSLTMNGLLGLSCSWWITKHNRHHKNPNQLGLDPDLDIPVLAFTVEQAESKQGVLRFMVNHQAYFLLPLFTLEGLGLRVASAQYLLKKKGKYLLAEPILMVAHILAYLSLLFTFLTVPQALLFILVHQALFGLYMGFIFAPNHKGMPILDKDTKLDFLRCQVLTSRNVKAHPLTDFLYGGLNYQIEHHLFPSLPRNRLREAQKTIRAFCREHSISYTETSPMQSYKEILRNLREISVAI